jgi:hypothetical protein
MSERERGDDGGEGRLASEDVELEPGEFDTAGMAGEPIGGDTLEDVAEDERLERAEADDEF